jgi:hypothetical protein
MTTNDLKKILKISARRMLITGIVVFGLAILLTTAALSSGEMKTVYWVFIGFFALIGLLMFYVSFKSYSQIASGKQALLNAILNSETDYVIWIYHNLIVSQVSGVNAGKSSNIVYYTKHGKMEQIVLSKRHSADEVIRFIAEFFPTALVGHSQENKDAAEKILSKKL